MIDLWARICYPAPVSFPRFTGVRRSACLVALAALLVNLFLLHSVVQNGDAAVYNQQIESGDLGGRTTHVGYMTLGFLFNAISPFDVDLTMNLFALLCASLGAAAIYVITWRLSDHERWALVSVPLLFSVGAYLRGAVLGEVDVPACALVLCSVALAICGRKAWAGAVFGVAMLTTPVVATCLPMPLGALAFGVLQSGRERWVRRLCLEVLWFGLAALAVYVPAVLLVWQDYVHGGRGLLRAGRNPFDLEVQVLRSARFVRDQTSYWCALGLAGVLAGFFDARSRGLSLGVLLALVATTIGADRFLDVPVQLPQVCLLACFAVLVLVRLEQRVRCVAVAVILPLSLWPSYGGVRHEVSQLVEQRADYRAMAQMTPHMLAAGFGDSWDPVLKFEHGVYGKTGLGFGYTWGGLMANGSRLRRDFPDYAIWAVSRPPERAFSGFAQSHQRERRKLNGRLYEVWIPR
ncbi:MAG: hypothetical protein QM778_21760 [Myxococcales bacterium]